MATTLPSGQISLADIQSAYGGTNPIGINEYYRGGSYVDNIGLSDPSIPTSGAVSLSNFRGTKAWGLQVATYGDTTTPIIYGSHYNSGGGNAGSLNNLFGAGLGGYGGNAIVSGGSNFVLAPSGGDVWATTSNPTVQVSAGGLNSVWFPLVPTLYGTGYGALRKSVLALGTGDVVDATHLAPDYNTTFCWRHPRSSWTDSMITGLLAFNSTQLSKVQTATRVWWDWMQTGVNDYVATGFMIFNSSTYNASGAQACYNGKQLFYFTGQTDFGGEWSVQGFNFTPTVSGSGISLSLSNTGVNFTQVPVYDGYGNIAYYITTLTWQSGSWTGSTGRATEYILGTGGQQNNPTYTRSDYTVSIGVDDLVVPMMYNTDGFSAAAWDSNRNPLTARFKMFQAY
jgi:hypothetical protein